MSRIVSSDFIIGTRGKGVHCAPNMADGLPALCEELSGNAKQIK